MIHIGPKQLTELLDYPSLVEALQDAFCSDWTVPDRHHHQFDNPLAGKASTLLLMPAWEAGKYLGVKIVLAAPENARYELPAIQGIYTLFDADKGMALAQLDAPALTARRTAAASALASSFLSRPESQSLLMVGTGALAPQLITAHASVRPIKKVYLWGRSFDKATRLAEQLKGEQIQIETTNNLEEAAGKVDIISCATLSPDPLIQGVWLKPGQHIDLVGSYLPTMREADNEVIRRSLIFADTIAGASRESGDLATPLAEGLISLEDIQADLFDLCRQQHNGRRSQEEITCFKSVGHALEDLAAARLVYEKSINQESKSE